MRSTESIGQYQTLDDRRTDNKGFLAYEAKKQEKYVDEGALAM